MTAPLPLATWGPRRESLVVVASGDFSDAVAQLDLLRPGALERLLATGRPWGGRGRNAVVPLPGRAERLHLRPFRHGGWLAGTRSDRLEKPIRVVREQYTNAVLHRRGAPVPRPVLVAAVRRGSYDWRAAIGTVHVEGALNLREWLAGAPAPAEVLRSAGAVGRQLRRFHDCGGRHADLHLGNLLLHETDTRVDVVVVDLDRARIASKVSARRRMREIMRLYRSLVKTRLLETLPSEALESFLTAYTAGDTHLHTALLAHLPHERRRLALHRLLYKRSRRKRGRV